MRRPLIVAALLSACLLGLPSVAKATNVGSNTSGFTGVNRGVFHLGFENMLLLNYTKSPIAGTKDAFVSTTSVDYVGGITPKFFLINNLAVGASLNLFAGSRGSTATTKDANGKETETKSDSLDLGFLGLVTAGYYMRMGGSMFLVPEIGAGGFFGTRRKPVENQPNMEAKAKISGFAGRLDLGLVYFASPRMTLKAGLDVLVRVGTEKTDSIDSTTGGASGSTAASDSGAVTTIHAGFNVGLGYAF